MKPWEFKPKPQKMKVKPDLQPWAADLLTTLRQPDHLTIVNPVVVDPRQPLSDDEKLEALCRQLSMLDGKPLVVLGYPHPDIGAVIRGHLKHIDDPKVHPNAELNPNFFKARLLEIWEALQFEGLKA